MSCLQGSTRAIHHRRGRGGLLGTQSYTPMPPSLVRLRPAWTPSALNRAGTIAGSSGQVLGPSRSPISLPRRLADVCSLPRHHPIPIGYRSRQRHALQSKQLNEQVRFFSNSSSLLAASAPPSSQPDGSGSTSSNDDDDDGDDDDDRHQQQYAYRALLSPLGRFIIWLPFAGFVYAFVFSVGSVNGGSMSPSMNPDFPTKGDSATRDWVLLDKTPVSMLWHDWRVGDVVVFVSPTNPDVLQTKRIIALEGDILRTRVHQNSSKAKQDRTRKGQRWARVEIPEGHCWVEGDSSMFGDSSVVSGGRGRSAEGGADLSRDSRHYGPIPLALMKARVVAIVWPPNRAGKIPPRAGVGNGEGDGPPVSTQVVFGNTRRSRSKGRSPGERVAEDSPLTPYVEWESDKGDADRTSWWHSVVASLASSLLPTPEEPEPESRAAADSSKLSNPQAEEEQKAQEPEEGEGTQPRLKMHRHKPARELTEEERESRRRRMNGLSRGGRLGDAAIEEEERQGTARQ